MVVTHAASAPLRSHPLYRHLTQMLPPLGVAVLVYDRRGSGQSTGVNTGDFNTLADDAVAGVRRLKADPRIDPKRIGVWGLSQGGWLALLAASRGPDVAFAVSVSAPLAPADVQMMYRSKNVLLAGGHDPADVGLMTQARSALDAYARGQGTLEAAQQGLDAIKDRPWFNQMYLPRAVSAQNIAGWRNEIAHDPLKTVQAVRAPALILYGAADPEVPVAASMARLTPLAARRRNLSVAVIGGADHGMELGTPPGAFLTPAYAEALAPNAPEYFARLTGWLVARGFAR